MKISIRILLFLVFLGVLSYFFVKSYYKPQYAGELQIQGLQEEVNVVFDSHGVPHIYAGNAEDAYRALGYVHAQDRIFQMDMMRRVGSGTLAALLGKDLLDVDRFFRTLGLPDHVKKSTVQNEQFKDEIWYRCAESYVAGINEFISKGTIPIEYSLLGADPDFFTMADVNAVVGYMSFSFAMALQTDPLVSKIARDLGPEYLKVLSVQSLDEHTRIPTYFPKRDSLNAIAESVPSIASILDKMPTPPFLGSNGWVIGAERTASGKVIFCNDTHIGFGQPSVWYEAHIEYPGFNFYGNHLAGFPFALVGHSKHHSIGLTMFENDDFDLYLEELNPDNQNQVRFQDGFEELRSKFDTIYIKGEEPHILEIKSTRHGNVINTVQKSIDEFAKQPVTAWWVYLQEPTRALEATWGMAHAGNINEVEQAVQLIHAPGLNVMYGDSENNIAWWAAAKLPIRPAHVNSKMILDGASGKDEIEGWYDFEDNPMSINPPQGFVHSANNQPDTMRNGVLYPGYYYPGMRSKRIMDVISSRTDWTQEDIKSLQLDTYTANHVMNLQVLLADLTDERKSMHSDLLETLSKWEGTHEITQKAPVFYYKWLYHTLRLMMTDELGEEGFDQFLSTFMRNRSMNILLRTEDSPWWNNLETDEQESRGEIINLAFDVSLTELNTQLGTNSSKWEWGQVASLTHEHPLGAKKPLDRLFNVKTSKVEASDGALNKVEFKLTGEGIYKVKSGPAMRIIIDFADVEASESILPTGQSGNLFSPFYKDQAEMFVKGQYRPQLMNKEQIIKNAHGTLKLKPE